MKNRLDTFAHQRVIRNTALIAFVASSLLTPIGLLSAGTASAATTTSPESGNIQLAQIASDPALCTSATANNPADCAPWNEWQGDSAYQAYASNGVGAVYPTFTPGGVEDSSGYPNVSIYPSASSGTDGTAPYPSGVVGTPGPLDGYCGTGSDTTEATGSPVRQPVGSMLPLAPAYFPHIVRNADGSMTGYFDYRPKDADEAIVVAKSTDNGQQWTYEGEALEQNSDYCSSSDINDDGQGHANIVSIGGTSRLYTLERAAGDNTGVGMLVHTLNASSTSADPLSGLPATEQTGVDADDFASAGATINGTAEPINLTTANPSSGPEELVTGGFVDLSATPVPNASDVITCTTSPGATALTNCTDTNATIAVSSGDLIEQVLATVSSDLAPTAPAEACNGAPSTYSTTTTTPTLPCDVPVGPNTTNGDGGLEGFGLSVTNADNLDMAIFNANAPNRAYIDGVAVYCNQSNAYPTNKIENCTTGGNGSPLLVNAGDPVTSDPIIPSPTVGQTTGLVSPDGIVGVLPSYPGAPQGSTIVMYTEKVLNYFIAGETSGSGSTSFANISATSGSGHLSGVLNFFPGGAPADLPSTISTSNPVTVYLGDNTAAGDAQPIDIFVPIRCTGLVTNQTPVSGLPTDSLTGCAVQTGFSATGYSSSDKFKSNSFIAAPGAAMVSGNTLNETGEGSETNAQKLFKNNEDLTILRVAYSTDGTGLNFSSSGLDNGGIISGSSNGTTMSTGATNCPTTTVDASYQDISDPCVTTSPSNLNAYASPGTADADEMRFVGSAGSIITNPDGTYGLFLSGAWAGDGDSDAFNQVFYSTSSDGEHWSVPVSVVSTDYTFSASRTQDTSGGPLGISAYYSGRAYGPSVVQNPDGTLTMLFAGYRLPKTIANAGTPLGTNSSALYTIGQDDPTAYRNILVETLTSSTSPRVDTNTTVTSSDSGSGTYGTMVTYTATVSVPPPGTGDPTGTVDFTDTDNNGSIPDCSARPLSDTTPDTATCTTTESVVGTDTVTATYSGDSNYATSSSPFSEQIGQATPTITWDDPSPITFGTPLGSDQLDAVASVPGTFSYTPPSGTVLQPGDDQTLTADFTPDDQVDYTTASKSVTVDVVFTAPCITGKRSGKLNVTSGQAICVAPGASLTGPVSVSSGGALWVSGASITAPTQSNGAAALTLCGTSDSAPLTISGTTGPVLIGGTGCSGNTFSAPVSITANTGGVAFSHNHVSAPLTIKGNSGGFVYSDNTVTAKATVTGNT